MRSQGTPVARAINPQCDGDAATGDPSKCILVSGNLSRCVAVSLGLVPAWMIAISKDRENLTISTSGSSDDSLR
jgi:hypothetical protein